jgi:type II secretory pathway pseudopilin PulG
MIEVVVSIMIGVIMVGAVVNGYSQAARRAEWSAYSLAAQSLASQRMEMTRAAAWDTMAYGYPTNFNDLVQSNFSTSMDILDIPISKTNIVYATNTTTITTLSTIPPLKMVSVQTVWRFWDRGLFTNSVVTYRAPNQ